MTSLTKDGVTYYFEYDDEGHKIREIKNGLTTNYYYSGDRLILEKCGEFFVAYLYDDKGSPIGFQYHEPGFEVDEFYTFWFEKNLQGDVVALYDDKGIKLLSYTYDAWGNASVTYHTSTETFQMVCAMGNPIRYRGYYYDFELELYCLGTRYYDSITGRFISPDSIMADVGGDMRGYNLYAYCFNNPIMYTDHNGNWPKWLEKAKEKIQSGYNTWKEESFLYNVILKNITADAGIGFGMGGEIKIGPVKLSAITRIDIIGAELKFLDAKIGHYGKSAASAGIGDYSIGAESNTYESFDGTQYERTKKTPEFCWSQGGEFGFVAAAHASISISFTGIHNEFVSYGEEHGWW